MYWVFLNTEHTCSPFKFSLGDCVFYFGPEEGLQFLSRVYQQF